MTTRAGLALAPLLLAAACSPESTTAPDQGAEQPAVALLKGPFTGQNKWEALLLDGIDDYAEIPSSTDFDVDALTVEAWVRLDKDIGVMQARIANRQSSQPGQEAWGLEIFGAGYGLFSTGNEVVFHSNNCTQTKNLETKFNLQKGWWYHLAAVNDGTTLRVYVYGLLIASTSSNGRPCKPVTAPIVVGKTGPSPVFYFPGAIAELRVWGEARSAAEIFTNMFKRQPKGSKGHNSTLVGYWRFDEGLGTTAADASGGGDDATLMNGAGWAH